METKNIIIISVVCGVLLLAGVGLGVYFYMKRKKSTQSDKQSKSESNKDKVPQQVDNASIHSNDVKIEVTSRRSNADQTSNNFVQLDQTSQMQSNVNVSVSVSDRKILNNSSVIPSSKEEKKKDNEEEHKEEKDDIISVMKKKEIEQIENANIINDLDSKNSRIKNIFKRYNPDIEIGKDDNEIEEEKNNDEESSSKKPNDHISYEESRKPNEEEYVDSNEYDNPELENEIKNQIGKYIMGHNEEVKAENKSMEEEEDKNIEKDMTDKEHSEIFTEE